MSAYWRLMTALATRPATQSAAEDERIVLAALAEQAHGIAEKILGHISDGRSEAGWHRHHLYGLAGQTTEAQDALDKLRAAIARELADLVLEGYRERSPELRTSCAGFPDNCPNPIGVAAEAGHGGGVRCGCDVGGLRSRMPSDELAVELMTTGYRMSGGRVEAERLLDQIKARWAERAMQRQEVAHDELRPYFHGGLPCQPRYDCHVAKVIDVLKEGT